MDIFTLFVGFMIIALTSAAVNAYMRCRELEERVNKLEDLYYNTAHRHDLLKEKFYIVVDNLDQKINTIEEGLHTIKINQQNKDIKPKKGPGRPKKILS